MKKQKINMQLMEGLLLKSDHKKLIPTESDIWYDKEINKICRRQKSPTADLTTTKTFTQ